MPSTAQATCEVLAPGAVVLRFLTAESVNLENSVELQRQVLANARNKRVVLVGVTPSELRIVAPEVVSHWLQFFRSGQVDLRGLSVKTDRLAVRATVRSLHLALRALGSPVELHTGNDLEALKTWAIGLAASWPD